MRKDSTQVNSVTCSAKEKALFQRPYHRHNRGPGPSDAVLLADGSTEDAGGFVEARVMIYEDRIIPLERKFFCNRATEKTVTLYVRRF